MAELRRARGADQRFYVGASGSGKSHAAARDLRTWRGARAFVWDFKDDHHELPTAAGLGDFARRALLERRLRYVPRYVNVAEQFDLFCRIVWTVQEHDTSDALVVAEELSEVTSPSWAPEWWRRMNNQGRVYGLSILGTSQFPAQVDMSFRANANRIRCGVLREKRHALTMAERLGVDARALQTLPERWAYVFDGRRTWLENPRGREVPHVSATA